jgi:DNA-binding transcriptional MerR regulator
MAPSFAIGDFSRATHLTVKTLRHYHETGLLEPAHIDSQTGYRRYTTDQIPIAQIIRRFRDQKSFGDIAPKGSMLTKVLASASVEPS